VSGKSEWSVYIVLLTYLNCKPPVTNLSCQDRNTKRQFIY